MRKEKTKLIALQNGEDLNVYEVNKESGAETGDLIYDFSEKTFYPVYKLGNTKMYFNKEFQSQIHKVIKSWKI